MFKSGGTATVTIVTVAGGMTPTRHGWRQPRWYHRRPTTARRMVLPRLNGNDGRKITRKERRRDAGL
jgi:hypothetical protein